MNVGVFGLVILSSSLAQPGTVAVVNGDKPVITFNLPAGTPYQLDYPSGSMLATFDSAGTNGAFTFQTYTARSKGDFNSDGVVNGRDVKGFTSIMIAGTFSAIADFNDDSVVDVADIAGFAEALTGGYPANGIVLHLTAYIHSTTLGDAAVSVLTDPDMDDVFTVSQTHAVTLLEFSLPGSGAMGSPAEFYIYPSIAPLIFDSSATASWNGVVLVDSGTAPPFTVNYSGSQVRVRSGENAALLIGDGTITGVLSSDALLHSTGATRGRVTFNLGGTQVVTPQFDYFHSQPQFSFVALDFDPHDPAGYEPTYGGAYSGVRVLHVVNPSDPQLDSFWFHQAALQVPVEENADSTVSPPASMVVDLLAYDDLGQLVDSVNSVTLSRIDADDDPFVISYRSDLAAPLIVVDAAVNEANFPDLEILQVVSEGQIVVRRH